LVGPVVIQRFIWSVVHAFGLEERLFYVINGAYIIFIFMKGYEFAYILIPAHRTDRYKRNDLDIRKNSI
jgi:hypothetical protein